ncbi:MAG TPA: response regulator [Candidatus Polarisedimenticolia bacterium]|nr:response regulator [Candidatus Polarisedimenticolia bacterium]
MRYNPAAQSSLWAGKDKVRMAQLGSPRASRPRGQAAGPPRSSPRAPRRILLIEDNPVDAMMLRVGLEERGIPFEMQVLHHGDVAMAFARREGTFSSQPLPDMILVDLNIPGYSGSEVLKQLSGTPAFRTVKIGVFTSSNDPRDEAFSRQNGAQFYLNKPMDLEGLDRLSERITRLLGLSREDAG